MIKNSSEGKKVKVGVEVPERSYKRIDDCPYLYSELVYFSHGQDGRWQITRYLGPKGEWFQKRTKVVAKKDGAGHDHLEEWLVATDD
jgi:hypothetical protein